MSESARYAKIVEWSDEDQCYVGSARGLIFGGCHGADEKSVLEELCDVVEEAITLYHWFAGPSHVRPAARRIRSVISCGCEMSDKWLAFTSIVVAPMRLAMNRSRSGLIVRSSVETA